MLKKIKYDSNAKIVLANKSVLARILKYTTSEFKDYAIDEIISCIENPMIGEDPVMPGEELIIGANTEDAVLNEGKIYFDVFFFAYTKGFNDKIGVKLYFDIEAQKNYYPGYDLVTRSLFYCARELSKQYDTEFSGRNYDNIKKVYSIWICMDTPEKYANTVTSYRIKPEDLYGKFTGKARYDILESIFIRLKEGYTENSDNDLVQFLSILFSNQIKENDKIARLDNNFGFKAKKELGEVLHQMCNLSELIEEKGIEKGIEQGIEKGIKQGIEKGRIEGEINNSKKIAKKMLDLGLNIDMIIQCTGLSKERIEALKQEIGSEKSSLSGMSLF